MNGQDHDPRRMAAERRAARRTIVAPVAKPPASGGQPKHDRHAAITDNLSKWQNYKRWTEKIRSTWSPPDKIDE